MTCAKMNIVSFKSRRLLCSQSQRFVSDVNALRELQSTGGEELSVLMPSVMDKAFKGEL